MAYFKRIFFAIAQIFVVANFLEKGFCDDICPPHDTTNITGEISGEIVHPSSGTYGANETKCWRIEVPKPYIGIGITYHRFEIEECPNCACDSFMFSTHHCPIRYGRLPRWCWAITCGRYSPDYLNEQFKGTGSVKVIRGQNVYLRWKTDDSIHLSGINLSFIVGSYSNPYGLKTCLNVSSGEINTPKFGSKNYPVNFDMQWYLVAPEGHQIRIKFELFELEQSEHCQNDYLEIREAYFQDPNNHDPKQLQGSFGAILAKPMCGTNLPSKIHSAGNMVWVHFRSDRNATTTYKGFKATFTSSESTTLSISYASSFVFLLSLITVTAI